MDNKKQLILVHTQEGHFSFMNKKELWDLGKRFHFDEYKLVINPSYTQVSLEIKNKPLKKPNKTRLRIKGSLLAFKKRIDSRPVLERI